MVPSACQRHLVHAALAFAAVSGLACGAQQQPVVREVKTELDASDLPGAVAAYRDYRAAGGKPSAETARVIAETVVWWSLRASNADVRAAAVRVAARTHTGRLDAAMSKLLADPDPFVRAEAAATRARHDDGQRVLVELTSSPSAPARALAIRALGVASPKTARQPALALAKDSDPAVRAAAAGAIAEARDASDRGVLEELAADADNSTRAAALRGLGRLGDAGALPIVRAHLADAYLGARLAALAAVEALAGEAALAELQAAAASSDGSVAAFAAGLLWKSGDKDAARGALRRAVASPEWTARASALNAAYRLDAASAIALADLAASDGHPGARLAAARVYDDFGARDRAADVFLAVLADPDVMFRAQAAAELAGHPAHRERAIAALDPLIREGSIDQRLAALAAANDVTGAPLDAAVAALADPSYRIQLAAAAAIL